MSLLLQTCNCSNCQSEKVIFNDETGLYATNGTGYGAPNLAIADITLATIDAIYPNGTVAQTFPVTADVILDATGFFTKEFSPSDFGLTAFEDGWGKFTYNVQGNVVLTPSVSAFGTFAGGSFPIPANYVLRVNGVVISDTFILYVTDTLLDLYNKMLAAIVSYGSGYTLTYNGLATFATLHAPAGTGASQNTFIIEDDLTGDYMGVLAGGVDEVLGPLVSYSSVKEFFYACGLKCCVAKQAAKAALEDEACCDDCSQKKLYAKMKNAYEIMQDALGKCGNKAAANKQWERLKLLCAGKDCGCS
jgi:hypothetical protein